MRLSRTATLVELARFNDPRRSLSAIIMPLPPDAATGPATVDRSSFTPVPDRVSVEPKSQSIAVNEVPVIVAAPVT